MSLVISVACGEPVAEMSYLVQMFKVLEFYSGTWYREDHRYKGFQETLTVEHTSFRFKPLSTQTSLPSEITAFLDINI